MKKKGKVLVAMSGGVDSTAAAILLLEEGYEIIGVTMKVWDSNNNLPEIESACCSIDASNDAKNVAVKLGFPHYVVDLTKIFKNIVINNFIEEYLSGRTPNPCVMCNKHIKWNELLKYADKFGCEFIATGHYASVSFENNRYFIKRGTDKVKDQSYMLWSLTQENLKRTLLPLGVLSKFETRKIVEKAGFKFISDKSESFDICFIPDNNYRRFLKNENPELQNKVNGGDFILNDKVIGKHKGYPFYTIGQRKGLEVAVGHPLYVTKIDAEKNQIFLGEKNMLLSGKLYATEINSMKFNNLDGLKNILATVRYHDNGIYADLKIIDDKLIVNFHRKVTAVTPGQSVVFYEGENLIGGGIIIASS